MNRKKLIKDIYKGQVTDIDSFFQRYLVLNKPLPKQFKSELYSEQKRCLIKYFLIKDKNIARNLIQEFIEIRQFLVKNGLMVTKQQEFDFEIIFVYKFWKNNLYTEYDPFSSQPNSRRDEKFIVNRNSLKWYIRRGCRTREEFSKHIRETVKFIIAYIIVPIAVVLTFLFQFVWKPHFLSKDKAQINQQGIMDSQADTLSKPDSLK